MIDQNYFKLEYIKKEPQSGSHIGMRFTFQKDGDNLLATIYPEPYCMAATPADQKETKVFELNQDGVTAAADWLNECYEARREYWENAYENRMK